jgi:hypothetical protein
MVHLKEESNPKSFLINAKINEIDITYGFEERERRKKFLDYLHEICGEQFIKFEYELVYSGLVINELA